MKVKSFLGGFDKNFSYLIWCESTQKASIIDAAVNIHQILNFVKSKKLIIEKLFITHSHNDHIKYINDFIEEYPNIQICGFEYSEKKFDKNYRGLSQYEIITLGEDLLTILHTPGHYPDSICLWNKKDSFVFTGDTMFVGRTGRTIGTKSNISHLYHSIYEILLKLPPLTKIYPGHHYGYKKCISIKENIIISPFFNCNTEEEFIQVMEQYEKNR